MSKPRIAVLGAGPAGMTAAWRLSELGYPVTVLERDDAEPTSPTETIIPTITMATP